MMPKPSGSKPGVKFFEVFRDKAEQYCRLDCPSVKNAEFGRTYCCTYCELFEFARNYAPGAIPKDVSLDDEYTDYKKESWTNRQLELVPVSSPKSGAKLVKVVATPSEIPNIVIENGADQMVFQVRKKG